MQSRPPITFTICPAHAWNKLILVAWCPQFYVVVVSVFARGLSSQDIVYHIPDIRGMPEAHSYCELESWTCL